MKNQCMIEHIYTRLLSRTDMHADNARAWAFEVSPDGKIEEYKSGCRDVHIVCGSFNPLHQGHIAIYNAIEGLHRYFEFSIRRHGKEVMPCEDFVKIVKQFEWFAPLVITNQTRYFDKLQIFYADNVIYHVGWDTAKRIIDTEILYDLNGCRCNFVVYPREVDGVIKTIKDLPIRPKSFMEGYLPESVASISSTKIRDSV